MASGLINGDGHGFVNKKNPRNPRNPLMMMKKPMMKLMLMRGLRVIPRVCK
jgi:hypothetical protein